MRNPIKVLFADDHFLIRKGLCDLLQNAPALHLTGEAENGRELLQLSAALQPDVIITDIEMPVMDGMEVTRQLAVAHPHISIVVYGDCADAVMIHNITEAGAGGYVMKTAHPQQLLNAINAVYHSRTYYCTHTLQLLKAAGARQHSHNGTAQPKTLFTERELQVMSLIYDEKSNKEIGIILAISSRTVEHHREKILCKTGSKNLAGIVKYVQMNRLFVPSIYLLMLLL